MRRFLVIGDATLDVAVAPTRPMRHDGDVPAAIRLTPGGQGANVAVRLARRGAEVTLLAAIGTDAAGQLVAEALRAEGVRLLAPARGQSGAVVVLLDPDGARSMLSDRRPLPAMQLASLAKDASWIHVSGYPIVDEAEGDELVALLDDRREGQRLSVAGGSIPPAPEIAEQVRARLDRLRPQLLVVNRDEAAALLGFAAGPGESARHLGPLAPLAIVTAGELGSAAWVDGTLVEVPAAPADSPAVDATGSGDAYLAALLLELAPAAWPPPVDVARLAMEVASLAGSQAARVIGAQGPISGEVPRAGARP